MTFHEKGTFVPLAPLSKELEGHLQPRASPFRRPWQYDIPPFSMEKIPWQVIQTTLTRNLIELQEPTSKHFIPYRESLKDHQIRNRAPIGKERADIFRKPALHYRYKWNFLLILAKAKFNVHILLSRTLKRSHSRPKGKMKTLGKANMVCKIPYRDCPESYIEQSRRETGSRPKEHKSNVVNCQAEKERSGW